MAAGGALNGTAAAALNATNETAVAVANGTLERAADAVGTAQSFIPLVFIRLWDLVAAPFRHGEMLWIIFPLFFTLIVMEIYYDRHEDEEFGWGATVANSLVLIFVAIDLIKESFGRAAPWTVFKDVFAFLFTDAPLEIPFPVLLLIGFLLALGLGLTVITFFHLLPRKMAYGIAGHPPVNFLAFFAIAIVYSAHSTNPIPFDLATLTAGALLFILILLAVFSIKRGVRRLVGDNSNRIWN